ncbi:MAG: glycosyltransferase family 39 protein [Chloroflexi bacterium]|nr:glycosyltransferase family 39 protein [Chloroflexota bacterium]
MQFGVPRTFWYGLIGVVVLALIARALLLATGTVSFHSDEAVIALMARHILEGERPVFFYGQAYMGSLDAWLVAVGFRLFGESVLSIRLVQSALYLLVVATGYTVAWRLSARVGLALIAGLLLAVPTTLLAVYTTATLGGYNEILLLGNLVLLFGWDVTHEHRRSLWRWAALGLAAGIGWWSNGLIVAFALPIALLILADFWRQFRAGERALPGYLIPVLIAAVGFVIGSAPWWVFNFQNDFAALSFLIGGAESSEFAGTDIAAPPLLDRLFGLVFLGLPTLIGLRFPWHPAYVLPALGVIVVAIYLIALWRFVRVRPADSPLKPDARPLLLALTGLHLLIFVASRFSSDPTGRYFVPLALPAALLIAAWAAAQRRRLVQVGIVAVVIGYQLAGVATAVINTPPGLTTQFNLDTHIPNDHDAALIEFLEAHDLTRGYTNYWVSFRIAFLSDERVQYAATLPYLRTLTYTPRDNRYPAYLEAADQAARVGYVVYTTPETTAVRDRLEAMFAAQGATYTREQIGPYVVYYDFSPQTPRPPLPFLGEQDAGSLD